MRRFFGLALVLVTFAALPALVELLVACWWAVGFGLLVCVAYRTPILRGGDQDRAPCPARPVTTPEGRVRARHATRVPPLAGGTRAPRPPL